MNERLGRDVNIFNNDNPCYTCNAACCGPNINIILSREESNFIRSSETEMFLVDYPAGYDINKSLFLLESKCGFVVNNICSVYDDPRRPDICGRFKAGGKVCNEIKDSKRIE